MPNIIGNIAPPGQVPIPQGAPPNEQPQFTPVQPEPQPESQPEETENKTPTDIPLDTPLWEGGVTKGQVDNWKAQYGDGNVYLTEVGIERYIIWRTLKREEYRQIVAALEREIEAGTISQSEANLNNEEMIAQMCILYPKFNKDSIKKDLGGIPSLIAQQIMEASAFVSLQVRAL